VQHNYTGLTNVAQGTLLLSGSGRLTSTATPGVYNSRVLIGRGATLKLDTTVNQTFGGVISGQGQLIKDGTSDADAECL
jgi:hypothetical protein